MNERKRLAPLLAAATLSLTAAFAQVAGPEGAFDLSWHTFDSGGGTSNGGTFEVTGTIGQPDAGPALAGGVYQVLGGFWAGGVEPVPNCPADVAQPPDGVVNIIDLLYVVSQWGQPGGSADVNGDNVVNILDLLAVVASWGMCP